MLPVAVCWKMVGIAGILCLQPADSLTPSGRTQIDTQVAAQQSIPNVSQVAIVRAMDIDWLGPLFMHAI